MSNETDLDWLARNVHVWPCGMREVLVCYHRNVDTLIWSCVLSNTGWITKEQWLTRRTELQNKPSWEGAPDWAEWLSQDEDGEWKWLYGLPGKYVDGWTAVKIKGCCKGLALGEWRDTLEKRPEEFKPVTGIEDNQEQAMAQKQEMKQDNRWFERGELPPVGVECEAKKYGKEEWYKVVICGAGKHLGLAVAFYEKQKGSDAFTCSSAEYFRPIRTEREVLIEVIKKTDDTDDRIADAILAAGFKLEVK